MGAINSWSADKAVACSVFITSGSFAAASSTLPIHLYSASSPGIGGTCFMTAGRWSKNVAGSTQGGWVDEYLAGAPFLLTTGSLLQSFVFIFPSNWLNG